MRFRSMYQVQIDVIQSALLQADLDRFVYPVGGRVPHELGGEEDFLAGDVRGGDEVVDRATAICFVFVPFRSVDMTIPCLITTPSAAGLKQSERRWAVGRSVAVGDGFCWKTGSCDAHFGWRVAGCFEVAYGGPTSPQRAN